MNWGEIWGAKEEPEFTPAVRMNLATHQSVPSTMNTEQKVYQLFVHVDLEHHSGRSVGDILLGLGGWISDRDVQMIIDTTPQFWMACDKGDLEEFANRIALAMGSSMMGGAASRAARFNMLYNIRSHINDHIRGEEQLEQMAEKMNTSRRVLQRISKRDDEFLTWEDVHELHNNFLEQMLDIAGAE